MKFASYSYLSVLLVFFLGGCLPQSTTGLGGNGFAPHKMTGADFKAETARLNAITEKAKTVPNEKAEAHRRLAIIYLSPGNPKQDQKKALAELGKYFSLNQGKLNRSSIASWAKAIESAKEFEQARQKISRLEKKNRNLGKTEAKLKEQNAKLKKTIEQLKDLDLSLEKKRKKLR
ncbi:MAG: hypothetical protein ABFQ82_03295 [Thermodesulfobacteriota bacterium]